MCYKFDLHYSCALENQKGEMGLLLEMIPSHLVLTPVVADCWTPETVQPHICPGSWPEAVTPVGFVVRHHLLNALCPMEKRRTQHKEACWILYTSSAHFPNITEASAAQGCHWRSQPGATGWQSQTPFHQLTHIYPGTFASNRASTPGIVNSCLCLKLNSYLTTLIQGPRWNGHGWTRPWMTEFARVMELTKREWAKHWRTSRADPALPQARSGSEEASSPFRVSLFYFNWEECMWISVFSLWGYKPYTMWHNTFSGSRLTLKIKWF